MKELFASMDLSRIGLYHSTLQHAGIASFIQNGTVLSPVVRPTLCIVDDERYEEAVELLKPYQESSKIASLDWICTKCGESNPGSFDVCWNCEAEKTA